MTHELLKRLGYVDMTRVALHGTALGVDHQLYVYAGETHLQVRTDTAMLSRVQTWYAAHGMF